MECLTKGSIQSMIGGEKVNNPILQVSNCKPTANNDSTLRYRLILTDGVSSHSYVILATQLNEKVESGALKTGSVIRLDNYTIKTQNDKIFLLLLGITVMDNHETNETPVVQPTLSKPKAPASSQNQLGNRKIMPISLINSYQNNWRIEGRVLTKTPLKSFKSARGEGHVFSFTLCDSSCDVKIASFNKEAEKFFDLIHIGRPYSVTKGIVKTANATYNSTKCDYEISLTAESEVTEIVDDEDKLPKMLLNFVPIDEISQQSTDTFIDVVGVAHSIMDTATLTVRTTNKELLKRDVNLVDRSGSSIKLTLWGDQVTLLDNVVNPVIVVKSASVKEFNGRTLSCGFNSTVLINPTDIPEAIALARWYEESGSTAQFQAQMGTGSGSSAISIDGKTSTLADLACASESDKGEYYTVDFVSISQFKQENIVYKACATDRCNKKLVDQNNGLFLCEKCNKEGSDFSYRMIMNMYIIDHTGAHWVTCFQEVAERILGHSAAEIGSMTELDQREELNDVFKGALFKTFQFKLRAKNETYNDETRMKVIVVDGKEIDNVTATGAMMSVLG